MIYICEKTVKLNQKWNEDYLNRHANRNSCNCKTGQRTIYCFFKSNFKKGDNDDGLISEEEYDSDICNNINNDDIISVDTE